MPIFGVILIPHFPTFGLNTERYGVSVRIQSKCEKMETRITPNMDNFYAVLYTYIRVENGKFIFCENRYYAFSFSVMKMSFNKIKGCKKGRLGILLEERHFYRLLSYVF